MTRLKLTRRDEMANRETKEHMLLSLRVWAYETESNIKLTLHTESILREAYLDYQIEDAEVSIEMENLVERVEDYRYAVGENDTNGNWMHGDLIVIKDEWLTGRADNHETMLALRDVAEMLYQSAYIAYCRAIGYDGAKLKEEEKAK